jgi:hypothetical protein
MRDYLATLEPPQALRLLSLSLSLVCLSFLPLCAVIFAQGRKIMVSECYPAPGTKVLWDTEVIRVQKAVSRGRLLVRLALLMAVLAILAAGYFPLSLNNQAASQKRFQSPRGHGLLVERSAANRHHAAMSLSSRTQPQALSKRPSLKCRLLSSRCLSQPNRLGNSSTMVLHLANCRASSSISSSLALASFR